MKVYQNFNALIVTCILLLAGNVSLAFAADNNDPNPAVNTANAVNIQQQLQQIAQLQQQAQVGAAPSASPPPPPPPPAPTPPLGVAPAISPTPAFSPANVNAGGQAAISTQDINNAAFNAVVQNALPMTPEQIQRLRQLFSQSQLAASALPGTPARPVISSQSINLAPGSTPPAIRLQQGMVSLITFIDSTGAPWPIQAYDIGNPAAFNIQWNKSDNTLMIQPLTLYTYGNLAISLVGLTTPLTLMLTTGQKAFDARLDLHVQGRGPNAQITAVGNGLPASANPDLLGILDGVPPTGSTTLQVTGGPCQAWLTNDRLFIRTRFTVLSPGWIATMSSADGMKAYELPKTPLLLATQNGKIIQLKIEGI